MMSEPEKNTSRIVPKDVTTGINAFRSTWPAMMACSLIPVVTSFGTILLVFFSGSLIIERVFNWPGLGRLTFEAAVNKDYPLVQAGVVISSVLLIVSYILRDVAYAWVDPRIKVR